MVEQTPVRITIGSLVLNGTLRYNSTALDLLSQLPLTLAFRQFNGVETVAKLPRELTMVGVPVGDDPSPADIGYYAPTGELVLYYGEVGYWDGIVRLGQFEGGTKAVRDQPRTFSAVMEKA